MLDSYLFSKHLEEDELVTQIVHKHWLMGLRTLFWPTVGFVFGLFFLYIAPVKLVLYVVLAWSVYAALWWARNFFDYYLDAWIITDQGIIDLHWMGWFHRQSTRVLYSDLQGVSYEIQGMVGTMLQYGTLSIEKISTGANISLSHVENPRKIEAIILRNMETYLHKKNLKNAKHVQELLAGFVAEQVQAHPDNLPQE